MLDLKKIMENPEKAKEMLLRRNFDLDINSLKSLVVKRETLNNQIQNLRTERNAGAKKIGEFQVNKNLMTEEEFDELKQNMTLISEKLKDLENDERNIEPEIQKFLLYTPNIPDERTPVGSTEDDNVVVRHCGEKPKFDFEPKSHYEIGEKMGIIDFKSGAKLAGSRFTVLRGAASLLERAVGNFLLDVAVNEHGYTPVSVPFMVNRETMTGTGQLPKFENDMFKTMLGERELFLIPTAEVPVTNIYSNEILNEDDLTISLCALTPCFRSEAGSAGKDVRGLIRQHQFDKLEMVKFTHPQKSWEELEKLAGNAGRILEKLGLHYRVVSLCTSDIGFAASFCYDLEVWLPGQNSYREISSCSNFLDFQSRRANIRFKEKETKKNKLVHTLNGSGMPIGRTLIAIIENYQQSDGSIIIPDALIKYTSFKRILPNGQVE